MTLTANPRAFADAERASKDFVCADCGGVLVVRNSGGDWLAMCATHSLEHTGFTSRTELEKAQMRERLERDPRLSQALAIQGAPIPLTTQALGDLSDTQLQSRVQARFANVTDATPALRAQILGIAKLYKLDPLFDLTIYEGRPYVTYEGRLRKLREAPGYHGHKVRPLDAEEKAGWGYEPDDLVIQCDVDMGAHGVVTDFGVVRRTEIDAARKKAERDGKRPAPVGVHPQQIALKRAIARASKQAVGVDLPTYQLEGPSVLIEETTPARQRLGAGDPVARARQRFWSVAKTPPPDGLGLADEAAVHAALGVPSIKEAYGDDWDRALSDLTEAVAGADAAASTSDSESPDDEGDPPWGPEPAPEETFGDDEGEPTPKSAGARGEDRRADGGHAAVETAGAGGVAGGGDAPALPDLTAALRAAAGGGEEFTCLGCEQTFAAVKTKEGVAPARTWLEFASGQGVQRALCPPCARKAARPAAPVEAAG